MFLKSRCHTYIYGRPGQSCGIDFRDFLQKQKVDAVDDVKLFESGWKERYYKAKFGVDINTTEGAKLPRKVVQSFMEGICWTLLYYYRGTPSWIW